MGWEAWCMCVCVCVSWLIMSILVLLLNFNVSLVVFFACYTLVLSFIKSSSFSVYPFLPLRTQSFFPSISPPIVLYHPFSPSRQYSPPFLLLILSFPASHRSLLTFPLPIISYFLLHPFLPSLQYSPPFLLILRSFPTLHRSLLTFPFPPYHLLPLLSPSRSLPRAWYPLPLRHQLRLRSRHQLVSHHRQVLRQKGRGDRGRPGRR